MAQTEVRSKGAEKYALPDLTPTGLAAMGEKRMEEFAEAQAVIFGMLQETHRRWLDRMQSEARLASEFAHRVTNARSFPAAMAACREWASQQFEMMAEDGPHFLAGSQKVVETGARFLANGPFIMNESSADTDAGSDRAGRDQTADDRQRLQTHVGPATVSNSRTARHDSVDKTGRDDNVASL